MPRKLRRLGVWLDGRHIADLEQRHWNELKLRYTAEALDTWPLNTPVVSCSLPLSLKPADARYFCAGLLPEGQALQSLASRAKVATNSTFELLERYGRDIAGALVIADEPPDPGRFDVDAYVGDDLERAVDDLEDHPLGVGDDSELSLAGLQDKLLLVRLPGGAWGRPLHGRPSTHILKADDPRRPGLVAGEARCLTLAGHLGLTDFDHELRSFGDTQCLIVQRFDRAGDGAAVTRLHQEDLCQALGLDHVGPSGKGKYQFGGGPSFRDAARLLETYSVDPVAELDRLVSVITFTVAVGNADAHGKNLALLHHDAGSVTLAPLYDTVPTVLWPKLRSRLSMFVGGQERISEVTLDDIATEARSWQHPADRASDVASSTATRLAEAVRDGIIDPKSALGRHVSARCAQLLAQCQRRG